VGELPEDAKTREVARVEGKGTLDMLGLTLSELTESLSRRFKLDSRAKGVLVTDVKEGSAGKKAGLQEGDLIVEVAPDTVKTPAEFGQRIKEARKAKRKTVLLLTERKKVPLFIVLPIAKG
jgi:serine protease Do